MNFLNNGNGFELFREEAEKDTFIDKSLMINVLYRYTQKVKKYVCVTRPGRFGKTVAANMIAAFFDESVSALSQDLFSRMQIGSLKAGQERIYKDVTAINRSAGFCWAQQGKSKVIHINMIDVLTPEVKSFQDFYQALRERLLADLLYTYQNVTIRKNAGIPEILSSTNEKFIFVIDEWDAVFEMDFMTIKDREDYLLFLRSLLKDKSYVHFAYMTGILPIAKYSSGSPLNMFDEFTSFEDTVFSPFFGFTEEEIRNLMKKKGFEKPHLQELAFWYDGYYRDNDGVHLFNPSSVTRALATGRCKSYWTGTGPMNEVQNLIRYNVKDLRNDVIRMVGGEELEIDLRGFSIENNQINTKNEILSAMVVYGFLTYHDGRLRIPNHELLLKFQEALASETFGLKQTLESSKKLLEATVNKNSHEVAQRLKDYPHVLLVGINYSEATKKHTCLIEAAEQ